MALPGKRDELIKERQMENVFNRERGRGGTLIFVHDQGAAWDVITLDVYRDWRHYGEQETIPADVERRRGEEGRLHQPGRDRALHAHAHLDAPRHARPHPADGPARGESAVWGQTLHDSPEELERRPAKRARPRRRPGPG